MSVFDFANLAYKEPVVPKDVPPDISDRFINLSKIAQGDFGCVYKATDSRNGRTVALKLAERSAGDNTYQAELEHPYILPLIDVLYSTKLPKIRVEIFPYYETNLCNAYLEYKTILYLMRQLLGVTQFIHTHSIFHNDIMPRNIMIANLDDPSSIMIKLTDFGLSCKPLIGFLKREDYSLIVYTLINCLGLLFRTNNFDIFDNFLPNSLVSKLKKYSLTPGILFSYEMVNKLILEMEEIEI